MASGYSTGTEALNAEFGLSEEVGTLGLSLYIVSVNDYPKSAKLI
jgi:hypothetical protein